MTAVEWLDEQIQERVIAQDVVARKMIIEISIEDYMDVKRLAKEMEKQQIIDAYRDCHGLGHIYGFDGEEYYTSTYGSKGSDEPKTDKI